MSKKVHFMGIGGSGMSAAAMIAKAYGYEVSGCDLSGSTPYLDKLKKAGAKLYTGHDKKHLENSDILAVSPAALYQNKKHPEIVEGKKKKMMTWQEFMGKYLQKNKRVISITGTHGKSTTTSMVGLMYEAARLDPTVEVGAKVARWNANYRIGKSNIFINEADEFNGNFLHYYPDTVILNNIEFDHPDFFTSKEHVIETFKKFIGNLRGQKILVINQDSKGISKLFTTLGGELIKTLNIVGYTLKSKPLITMGNSFRGSIIAKTRNETVFKVFNQKMKYKADFKLKLPGDFNVSNALGVIALGVLDEIPDEIIKRTLNGFKGSGRRMEMLGEKSGVKVYDDYAHHPTAIKATLSGLRQKYPNSRIICIVY